MRFVSFAWTAPALLSGAKTVTRRNWDQRIGMTFHFNVGETFPAFDRNPRNGGKQIAECRIVSCNCDFTSEMTDVDYEEEGFAYLYDQIRKRLRGDPYDDVIDMIRSDELTMALARTSPDGFNRWKRKNELLWVVRFELVKTFAR